MDEVVLLRLVAEDRADDDRGLQGTCTYVLAEAGAGVGEVTAVYGAWIGGTEQRRTVTLPGFRRKDSNTILLDAWGSRHISRLLAVRLRQDGDDALHLPLTYMGKDLPGSEKAQQSSQPILNKMRSMAGLNTADTTALSIGLFRAGQGRAASAPAEEVTALLRTRTGWSDGRTKRLDIVSDHACRDLRIRRDEIGAVRTGVTEIQQRARRSTSLAA
jgi:hypothetical protein